MGLKRLRKNDDCGLRERSPGLKDPLVLPDVRRALEGVEKVFLNLNIPSATKVAL
jgi:hypothetical protein